MAHTAEPGQFVQFTGTSLRTVDAGSGRIVRTLLRPELAGLRIRDRFVAASPDGRTLAISNRFAGWVDDPRWAGAPPRLLDVASGEWRRVDGGGNSKWWHLTDARWSDDGRAFVAGLVTRSPRFAHTDHAVFAATDGQAQSFPRPRAMRAPFTVDVAIDGAVRFVSDGDRLGAVRDAGEAAVAEHGVRWFRCLDGAVAISHDTRRVTLWDIAGLRPLRSLLWPDRAVDVDMATLPGIEEDIELAALGMRGLGRTRRPSADGGPIGVAAITLDRRRIALAGPRDIVVWERRSSR